MRLFDPTQHRQVSRATARAERLTRDFYRIPGRERPRFPYDVATLTDAPGPRRRVFADIVRIVRPAPADASSGRREIYRIRLRDDVLLAATEDVGQVRLPSLLLYVLTHELVHVVRFASGLAAFEEKDPKERDREERRVHAITKKILQPAVGPTLKRVVDRYFDDGRARESRFG